MQLLPLIIPAKPPRRGRSRPTPTTTPPTPLALTLQSAVLEPGPTLTLVFDRAIDIGALDPGAFTVEDGTAGQQLVGDTASLAGAATIEVEMNATGTPIPAGPTTLTATAGNGIIATDDGGTWVGVTDLALPYP